MVEWIRRYITRMIVAKRVEGTQWKDGVGPRIVKILYKTQLEAIHCNFVFNRDMQFEVGET